MVILILICFVSDFFMIYVYVNMSTHYTHGLTLQICVYVHIYTMGNESTKLQS